MSIRPAPDFQGIADGLLPRSQALWQIGRWHVSHPVSLAPIGHGGGRPRATEGESTTSIPGVVFCHGPQGCSIRQNTPDGRQTLWSTKWEEIADIVRPSLLDHADALDKVLAARIAYTESALPFWEADTRTPDERDASRRLWQQIEESCYAAADAVWVDAQPAEQLALP